MMKKTCDNCSKELSKFSFFSPRKKIHRCNSAILCADCLAKISAREQLEEKA